MCSFFCTFDGFFRLVQLLLHLPNHILPMEFMCMLLSTKFFLQPKVLHWQLKGGEGNCLVIFILYTRKLSREKLPRIGEKYDFAEKTFADCSLLLRQRTPYPQILQRKLSWITTKLWIRKSFLPQTFPAIQYLIYQMFNPLPFATALHFKVQLLLDTYSVTVHFTGLTAIYHACNVTHSRTFCAVCRASLANWSAFFFIVFIFL